MADSNRIVFPDEVAEIKAKAKIKATPLVGAAAENKTPGGDTNTIDATPQEVSITNTYKNNSIMADSNRIVFPDEVAEVKAQVKTSLTAAAAEDKTSGGDTNTIDATPQEISVTSRNLISVPNNCPPGYQMGADGVCREVFN